MIAGALGFTNISCGTGSSRFVGIPDIQSPNNNLFSGETAFLIYGILIGLLCGLGFGLIIVGSSDKGKKKSFDKPIQEKEPIIKNKGEYPHNEIPRSIKDYYKKNK